jgi:prepilin-type processing-associated H-X9-DG protein
MYANDFDETLPQTNANINSQWLMTFHYLVPANWSSQTTHPAVIASPYVWPNSCIQYGITENELKCPVQRTERSPLPRFTYDTPLAKPIVVSYSMNGYLNSFKLTDIANKSQVPLIWEGRGKANPLGGVLNNPALLCSDGTQPCTYNTSCDSNINGGRGSAFGLASSVWTHGKTNHCLLVDGHVEQRKMGAVLSPENTDFSIDFYTGYNEAGIPGFSWTNGCHAYLFRPNR